MSGKELLDLFNKGIYPTVKFKEPILDLELQFEPNMLAKIVAIAEEDDSTLYRIVLEETDFKRYTKQLEQPICYNRETDSFDAKWSDDHERKDIEVLYIDKDELDLELENFEVIADAYSELVQEYLSFNTDLSYTEWLQERLLELRALQ